MIFFAFPDFPDNPLTLKSIFSFEDVRDFSLLLQTCIYFVWYLSITIGYKSTNDVNPEDGSSQRKATRLFENSKKTN